MSRQYLHTRLIRAVPSNAPGQPCADLALDPAGDRSRAVCRNGYDPEIWFPSPKADDGLAKSLCALCPLAQNCLDWAAEHQVNHGVWGGVNFDPKHVGPSSWPMIEGT